MGSKTIQHGFETPDRTFVQSTHTSNTFRVVKKAVKFPKQYRTKNLEKSFISTIYGETNFRGQNPEKFTYRISNISVNTGHVRMGIKKWSISP